VFLTNALTGRDSMVQLKLHFPEMQQEHDAAQRVKSEGKIIVILGNVKRDLFRQAGDGEGRSANLAEKAWKAFSRTWRLSGDLLGPQAIALTRELFRVCLVVCHAPLYERDHKDSLAQDWAHIPIPRLKGVFGKLAKLGKSIAILLDPLKDPSAVARKALAGDLKSLGVVWRAGGRSWRAT
jgi:hypothetical protein